MEKSFNKSSEQFSKVEFSSQLLLHEIDPRCDTHLGPSLVSVEFVKMRFRNVFQNRNSFFPSTSGSRQPEFDIFDLGDLFKLALA